MKAAWLALGWSGALAVGAAGQDVSRLEDLEQAVAIVLARNCLECHSGDLPSGELNLTRPDLGVRGKDLNGDPRASKVWQKVSDGEMPPEDEISPEDRAILEAWITAGAVWQRDPIDPLAVTTSRRAGRDWWSLQAISRPEVPVVKAREKVRNPIDAFVLAELEQRQLSYSAPASPQKLLRRIYFDLVGLPPPPEVVGQFERDPSDTAYEAIVDRLLASPEYGQRWARHWLDLVRYGESDGFERNAPRDALWHYRDWVIAALNADLPFDEFARRQICGGFSEDDLLQAKAATGFLVAGVHNTVVGTSKSMQLLARQDELEDLIGNVGQTFLGLTFNCARCHDHKFDPITQREYYQLVATFCGVNHGVQQVHDKQSQQQLDELAARIAVLRQKQRDLEAPARSAAIARHPADADREAAPRVIPVFSWSFASGLADEVGSLNATLQGDARLSGEGLELDGDGDFAVTDPLPAPLREKTLEVWIVLADRNQQGGGAISVETTDGAVFDALVFGEREPGMWMAGSNGFVRTQSFGGTPEDASSTDTIHVAITYAADGEIVGYRNGHPYGRGYRGPATADFQPGTSRILFGLRHSPPGGNRFLKATIRRAQVYDRVLSAEETAAPARSQEDFIGESELLAALDEPTRRLRTQVVAELKAVTDRRNELVTSSRTAVYTNVSSTPEPTYFLPRGDVTQPGDEMLPGTTKAIASADADFGLPTTATDDQRRQRFAAWVTSPDNPMLARVVVNRLWQHHFGRGLVRTPSDFGFNGGIPSHPKLLDWLADELKNQGFRLKVLHRLMVTSNAYRQGSSRHPGAMEIDSDNRLLWRWTPKRLDAEVIRDAMLSVAGKLNPRHGGPSFKDVEIIDQNNGTTYYVEVDREDSELNRRTIYRFSPRGGRSALLDTLDCPDPSAAAPHRSVTTTPLQALSLLNSALVLRLSEAWAARADAFFPGDAARQVDWMFRTALSRSPEADELARGIVLVNNHGTAALARALFNTSEFVIAE